MNMFSDKRIPIGGFNWRPDDLLEWMRSPELSREDFWRCMSYALYVMRDDEEYLSALNEVKIQRTSFSFPQLEATTPQNELPDAPPRVVRMATEVITPKVFHDNLDDRKIATALLQTDRLGLGPKQFTLAVQQFFSGIGWLVTTIDTQFIGWMKTKQIMNAAANNLQHVSQHQNTEALKANLKSTFQFVNKKGVWEDKREFYKRNDSQKINPGL